MNAANHLVAAGSGKLLLIGTEIQVDFGDFIFAEPEPLTESKPISITFRCDIRPLVGAIAQASRALYRFARAAERFAAAMKREARRTRHPLGKRKRHRVQTRPLS